MLFQWFGMLQVREMRFHYSNGLVVLRILRGSIGCKKCVLLAAMLLFHSCFFTHSINQGWANLFTRRVICKKTKTPCSEPQNQFVVSVQTGAQPELHFGEGNFQEISFDDVIMLTQPWLQRFRKRSQIQFCWQQFRKWELFSFNQDADRTTRTE